MTHKHCKRLFLLAGVEARGGNHVTSHAAPLDAAGTSLGRCGSPRRGSPPGPLGPAQTGVARYERADRSR